MVEGGPIPLRPASSKADLVDEAVLLHGEKSIGARRHRSAGKACRSQRIHSRRNGVTGQRKARRRYDRKFRARLDHVYRYRHRRIGEVRSVEPRAGNLHRITIACRLSARRNRARRIDRLFGRLSDGGGCGRGGRAHLVSRSMPAAETLRVTTAGRWRQGSKINLERPLKFGDELGGHLVAGPRGWHCDRWSRREDMTEMARYRAARAARARAFYRDQGIGHARRRLAYGQCAWRVIHFRCWSFRTLCSVTTFGDFAQGRRCQSRSRYDGAVRRAAGGDEVECLVCGRGPPATTAGESGILSSMAKKKAQRRRSAAACIC